MNFEGRNENGYQPMISISIEFAIICCSATLLQVKQNISLGNASVLYQILLPIITDDDPILKSHNNVGIYMAFKKVVILLATGRLSSTRCYIHMLWNGWKRVWQAKKPTKCSLRHQRMPWVFFQVLRWFSWWLNGRILSVKYTILKRYRGETVQSPSKLNNDHVNGDFLPIRTQGGNRGGKTPYF